MGLEKTPNLFVASSVLKVDDKVREAAQKQEVNFYDNKGHVTRIKQDHARKLIHAFGGRTLTSVFMYRLLIPSLKLAAEQDKRQAKATLAQMEYLYEEYLEDRILNFDTLLIGGHRGL